jgi:hypothetical protein
LSIPYRIRENELPGPNGEVLNTTVCRLGSADASKRLLVLSATHGVEGFAGAAIQTGWINCHHGDLAPDTAIVFVHQVNPWGMAWNRRENENNVDIFRNLNYMGHPGEADPLFDLVHETMDLANWDERTPEWLDKREQLISLYGMDRIIAAVRRGQHHCPEGMTFHGSGPEWSARVLLDVVDTELAGASHVAVIDIHTGFGEYGQPLVMSYDPPGSEQHTRVSDWFDGKIYTPGRDADIPSHLGSLPFAWMNTHLPDTAITAEILEFGTFDPTTIGEIFNANHHFHVYGDPLSAKGLEWGAKYRRYCYPEEEAWKELVWHHGEEVLAKTLRGLERWSGEGVTTE